MERTIFEYYSNEAKPMDLSASLRFRCKTGGKIRIVMVDDDDIVDGESIYGRIIRLDGDDRDRH